MACEAIKKLLPNSYSCHAGVVYLLPEYLGDIQRMNYAGKELHGMCQNA